MGDKVAETGPGLKGSPPSLKPYLALRVGSVALGVTTAAFVVLFVVFSANTVAFIVFGLAALLALVGFQVVIRQRRKAFRQLAQSARSGE